MAETLDFTLSFGKIPIGLRLYAEGALYWPDGRTIIITDPHFGKADSFRHAGIAIPTAVHDNDLIRLTRILEQSDAIKLVVLGDFFHSRQSQSANIHSSLEAWRRQHDDLEIVLVQGNHDLHAGPPPAEFRIESVEAPYFAGPFVCHHHPLARARSENGYLLAGHLHPYVLLHDRDGSRMRLASFIFGKHQAILPAFGGFTGGSHYPPSASDRVFAVSRGEIVEVPTDHRRISARS